MDEVEALRRRAEESLQAGNVDVHDVSGFSLEELRKLVHELRVHQIELEMQNEELRRMQHELEEAQAKYAELYEFAPAGYLTLDLRSMIQRINLSAHDSYPKKGLSWSTPHSRNSFIRMTSAHSCCTCDKSLKKEKVKSAK